MCGGDPASRTVLGTVRDMITVQRVVQTTLDAPSTFAYLSAFEHTPTWDPGTPVVEKQSTGPVAVGTKYHAVAEFRGKRQQIDYVVTEISADRIQLRGENKTVISVDTISVRPSKSGSEVTYTAEFTLKGVRETGRTVRQADVRKTRRPRCRWDEEAARLAGHYSPKRLSARSLSFADGVRSAGSAG